MEKLRSKKKSNLSNTNNDCSSKKSLKVCILLQTLLCNIYIYTKSLDFFLFLFSEKTKNRKYF